MTFTFQSNGKGIASGPAMNIDFSVSRVDIEFDYTVEGNKIKIRMPEETLIFTILDDGSIDSPFGI